MKSSSQVLLIQCLKLSLSLLSTRLTVFPPFSLDQFFSYWANLHQGYFKFIFNCQYLICWQEYSFSFLKGWSDSLAFGYQLILLNICIWKKKKICTSCDPAILLFGIHSSSIVWCSSHSPHAAAEPVKCV